MRSILGIVSVGHTATHRQCGQCGQCGANLWRKWSPLGRSDLPWPKPPSCWTGVQPLLRRLPSPSKRWPITALARHILAKGLAGVLWKNSLACLAFLFSFLVEWEGVGQCPRDTLWVLTVGFVTFCYSSNWISLFVKASLITEFHFWKIRQGGGT